MSYLGCLSISHSLVYTYEFRKISEVDTYLLFYIKFCIFTIVYKIYTNICSNTYCIMVYTNTVRSSKNQLRSEWILYLLNIQMFRHQWQYYYYFLDKCDYGLRWLLYIIHFFFVFVFFIPYLFITESQKLYLKYKYLCAILYTPNCCKNMPNICLLLNCVRFI